MPLVILCHRTHSLPNQWRLQREATGAWTFQVSDWPPSGCHLSFTHRDKIDIRPLLLYSEMNMHSKLYNKLLHELSLLASGPENVYQSLAYCTKSRAQVNKLVRCLDSCLPDDKTLCILNCIRLEPPLSVFVRSCGPRRRASVNGIHIKTLLLKWRYQRV